jgi:hypothetical protein
MPIEFFNSPEGLKVGQSFDLPTVYLDHWAIRLFSDDRTLQDRLVMALLQKRGTLLVSHFSMAELGAAADPRHVIDAEQFLERCFPQLFLTDFRLDEVLARERNESTNATRFWPTADLPRLKLFGERSQAAGRSFTMAGFANMAYGHRAAIVQLMNDMACKMKEAVEKARTDPDYIREARDAPLNDRRPRTLLIIGELLRGFIRDSNAPISENDAVDLIHAAMPLNLRLCLARWVVGRAGGKNEVATGQVADGHAVGQMLFPAERRHQHLSNRAREFRPAGSIAATDPLSVGD